MMISARDVAAASRSSASITATSSTTMRGLALECGYGAASLRERIYARDDDGTGEPMAGVLIYTAAPDSEGTLGGLVRMVGDHEACSRADGRRPR